MKKGGMKKAKARAKKAKKKKRGGKKRGGKKRGGKKKGGKKKRGGKKKPKSRKKSVRKAKKAVKKAKKAKKSVKKASKLRKKARASLRKKGKPIPRSLRKGGMKKAKARTKKASKRAKKAKKKAKAKPRKSGGGGKTSPPSDPCKTDLTPEGKKVLDKVAATLKQYAWMSVTAEGNSPAPGAAGKRLTGGRARSTVQYLKKKGCKNKFTERGKHSRLIGMVMYATGTASSGDRPPKGCGKASAINKKAFKKGAKKARAIKR